MEKKSFLLVLLLLLGIGFATVTTTLYINGKINIGPDYEGFKSNVVFKTAKLNGATSEQVKIIENGKKIQFTISSLKTVNETATISYTIENKSQYNARVGKLSCTTSDKVAATYLKVTPSNALDYALIEKNATSDEDTLTVTMIRSYAGVEGGTGEEEKSFTYTCELPVKAVEVEIE